MQGGGREAGERKVARRRRYVTRREVKNALRGEGESGEVNGISVPENVTGVWLVRVEHEASVIFVAKLRKEESGGLALN